MASNLVALMGPVNSGKTSLLATLRRCARMSHGFDRNLKMRLSDAPPQAAGIRTSRAEAGDLVARVGKWRTLAELEQETIHEDKKFQPVATLPEIAGLSLTLRLWREQAERGSVQEHGIAILDAGGGIIFPTDRQLQNMQPGIRKAYDDYRAALRRVTGLVVCVDVTDKDFARWETSFETVVTLLQSEEQIALRHIAIAFTKTESLFAFDGPGAILSALNPDIMRGRLRRSIKTPLAKRKFLEDWRDLHFNARRHFDIRCFATSAYGYVRQNGCANCTHNSQSLYVNGDDLQDLIREELAPPDMLLNEFWTPIMTIDPFVFAAFGDDLGISIGYDLAALLKSDRPDGTPEEEEAESDPIVRWLKQKSADAAGRDRF